jgi:hypothetical protein
LVGIIKVLNLAKKNERDLFGYRMAPPGRRVAGGKFRKQARVFFVRVHTVVAYGETKSPSCEGPNCITY